jgi:LemA protein
MKPIYIVLIAIGSIILFSFMGYYSVYSNAVSLQENVDEKWNNVQSAYQRRADLVPQLLATVKGAAANEKEILLKVTQARAGIVEAKTPGDLEIMGRKIETAINLAYEAYPQIKSTENFQEFQKQLEGTENRIKVSRNDFNTAVQEYNTSVKKFPMVLFSGLFGFKEKGFFAAEERIIVGFCRSQPRVSTQRS